MSKINGHKPCCLKNKIVEKGSKIDIICRFISYYMIIVGIAIVFYTLLVPDDKHTPSDVINIFIWGTYIMAPMILIWTYDSWKEQHNKEISSEMLKDTIDKLLINRHQLFKQMSWFKHHFSTDCIQQSDNRELFEEQLNILLKVEDELMVNLSTIKFILEKELYENKYQKDIGEFRKLLESDIIDPIFETKYIILYPAIHMEKIDYKKHCASLIDNFYKNNQEFYVIEYLENIIYKLKSEMEAR